MEKVRIGTIRGLSCADLDPSFAEQFSDWPQNPWIANEVRNSELLITLGLFRVRNLRITLNEVCKAWDKADLPELNQEKESRVSSTERRADAGMAPGKKDFISFAWLILGNLLPTFFVECKIKRNCPAWNVSP